MLRTAFHSTRQCSKRLLAAQKDAPLINLEQVRTTVIVEQVCPPKLAAKGALPKVMQRNRVLKFVDRVHGHKTPDITCILTDLVEGVGMRGDTVTVKRRLFRGKLYPAGLAVYPTPENVDKFAKEKEAKGITDEEKTAGVYGEMTLKQLAGMYLRVPMSGDNPWVLSPKHVRVALRKAGVEARESCITLPQDPVTGPEEFNFRVTVNGVKSVIVKGRVILRHNDPSKDEEIELPPMWSPTSVTSKAKQQGESEGDP